MPIDDGEDSSSRLLPRPPELSGGCFLSFQPQSLWEVLRTQDAHGLTTLTPVSLPGAAVRPSGQRFLHNPRAGAQLPAGLGSDPAAAGTLLVRGQSIPYHQRHEVPRGRWAPGVGWLRGHAAWTAAATEPKGLCARGRLLPGIASNAERGEYPLPSSGSERLRRGGSRQRAGAVGTHWELWMFLGVPGWEEWGGWMDLRVPGVLRPCRGDTRLSSAHR